ncbi:hypothetical protein JCM3775_001162 [Rhodotorula graminis]|uniref:F-box domain-containing protein n=1 Tax=Rhodotorula graminis (strain WP1) TaxID=578459 RepID=A0A194SCI7_RHOGW|nr:uncharacterized protein RHOBADRAFT_50799 [Rhodotorula graminis WP1]KPV78319.1 hypothetical protein RHOBADRAFT_50799 [Rhodotorula graminis WP1]
MSLDSLPPEVLAVVVAHLPLRATAVRPHSSLVSLASTSRHLYAALEPVINRTVALDSHNQAHALARDAPARHRALVRALHLRAPLSTSASTTWTIDDLDLLVHRLNALTDLHCTALAADPFDTLAVLAQTGTATRLDHLDLDFAPSSASPCPSSSSGDVDAGTMPLPSWLRACLAECPELRSLAVRNMPAVAPRPAAQSGSGETGRPQTRLERLELEATELDDAALDEVLGAAGATLDTLRLRRCGGWTSAGLVRAVREHGARLRHLEIVVGEASSGAPSSSSTPSSSPPPAASPLAHVVDDLLLYLPHLTTLTLSSPATVPRAALISPAALALLPTHTPHLAALHLDGPHMASDVLPLVRPAPDAATLRHLRVVSLHRPAPPLGGACDVSAAASAPHDGRTGETDDAAAQELWAAALQREVRLEGAQFERARTRLEWAKGAAWELVRDEAAAAGAVAGPGASARRRKRPSLL